MRRFSFKEDLVTRLWNVDLAYYASAGHAGEESFANHLGLQLLAEICCTSVSVLDCGCGEGTKLSRLTRHDQPAYGLDISGLAVSLGKTKYPRLRLAIADLEKGIPFPTGCFSCAYLAFTVEHLDDPDRAIAELVRVVRPGGWVVILSPNFGSPFFPSPCATGSFKRRGVRRLLKTCLYLFVHPSVLAWERVTPRVLIEGQWQSDWDTTVEPYVHTLLIYLERHGVEIKTWSSMWNDHPRSRKKWWQLVIQEKGEAMRQLCHILGEWGIPPFSYYGPNFFVVGQKVSYQRSLTTRGGMK